MHMIYGSVKLRIVSGTAKLFQRNHAGDYNDDDYDDGSKWSCIDAM